MFKTFAAVLIAASVLAAPASRAGHGVATAPARLRASATMPRPATQGLPSRPPRCKKQKKAKHAKDARAGQAGVGEVFGRKPAPQTTGSAPKTGTDRRRRSSAVRAREASRKAGLLPFGAGSVRQCCAKFLSAIRSIRRVMSGSACSTALALFACWQRRRWPTTSPRPWIRRARPIRPAICASAKQSLDLASQLIGQKNAEAFAALLPNALPGWKAEKAQTTAVGAVGLRRLDRRAAAITTPRATTSRCRSPAIRRWSSQIATLLTNPAIAGAMGKLVRVGNQRAIQDRDGNVKMVVANKFMIVGRGLGRRRREARLRAGGGRRQAVEDVGRLSCRARSSLEGVIAPTTAKRPPTSCYAGGDPRGRPRPCGNRSPQAGAARRGAATGPADERRSRQAYSAGCHITGTSS